MAPDRPLVGVYTHSEEERRLAEELLGGAGKVRVHGDLVEARLDEPGVVRELAARGLLVDVIESPPPPRGPLDARALRVERFRSQALHVSIAGGELEVHDEQVGDRDGRIHDRDEITLEPLPQDTLETDFYRIRLDGPITEDRLEEFVELGIDLAAFEPPDSYRTALTSEQYRAVRELGWVLAVRRHRFEDTITHEMLDVVEESGEERRVFDLVLHRVRDREQVVGLIDSYEGAEVIDSDWLYIRFEAPSDARLLAALGKLPEVRQLGVHQRPQLYLDYVRNLVCAVEERWNGQGEIVAICDSGIDAEHPDLADRISVAVAGPQGGNVQDVVGHGTHVAGTIAGTGAASQSKIRGMAPAAELAIVGIVETDAARSQIVRIPANWATLLEYAAEKGAKIINLSLGHGKDALYDFGSLAVDEFVHAHPDVLVVVAAGNDGMATKRGYVRLSSVGTPATAKNVLTVGATATNRPGIDRTWKSFKADKFGTDPCAQERMAGDADAPAALSSRGPTDFESIKPDVVAPGTYILAARSKHAPTAYFYDSYPDSNYGYLNGTSMATPIVAGAAALVRQYLREELRIDNPSAALLKAVLIASTLELPPHNLPDIHGVVGYPDFDQGFGRINLAGVLPAPNAPPKRKLLCYDVPRESELALNSRPRKEAPSRQIATYNFTVAEGATEPVRAVLAWTDYPGAWVQNNLALAVSGPDDLHHAGNPRHRYRRQEFDAIIQGLEEEQEPLDKRNNVEHVRVDDPKPGPYRIDVAATNTPFPPQAYALCVVGEVESELEARG
jgi:subtilisin family serine protease